MINNKYIQSLLKNYADADLDMEVSASETMNDPWYFEMGKYALDLIVLAVTASKIRDYDAGPEVTKVLDMPCGHGRVMRHMVNLFKNAEFHACDLDKHGVDFCASRFGAKPIYSDEELTNVDFGCEYDVIWVGSLFTHTSREVSKRWMAHLAKFLSPQGIIVATLHGRWSEHVNNISPYIHNDAWNLIVSDYNQSGYGYQDYLKEESHSYISGSYGVSLVKPHVSVRDVEEIPDTRIYLYQERAWGDHQDAIVFGRPSHAIPWPNV